MNMENDLKGILIKFLNLPKSKQMLVAGFVEGIQYDEIEVPKEKSEVVTV